MISREAQAAPSSKSNGTLTMLFSFCSEENCPEGGGPNTLVQGTPLHKLSILSHIR
jgi:hypothetical protein